MSTEKKLTAVEWLEEVYITRGCLYSSDLKLAKEKEKQQIIDANNSGYKNTRSAEQYYNETFKK